MWKGILRRYFKGYFETVFERVFRNRYRQERVFTSKSQLGVPPYEYLVC
jgi:hypothetical protein